MSEDKRLNLYSGVGAVTADTQSSLRNTLEELAGTSATTSTSAPEYRMVKQGASINALATVRTNGKGVTTDPITGIPTAINGAFKLTFEPGTVNMAVINSTQKLFFVIRRALAENSSNPHIAIPLSKYMQERRLKDEKEARKQVCADLDALFYAKLSWQEPIKGKMKDFIDMRILSSKGIRNGIIHATLATDYYERIKEYPPMWMPERTLMINDKRNPNTLSLLEKLCAHRFMNGGKPNEGVVSVQTLLTACPYIPPRERAGRHIKQQIIDPFERDMEAIARITPFKWHYCHAHGAPLTDDEIQNMTYDTFIGLNVAFVLEEYPAEEQKAKLERRAAKIEAAKKRRPRAKKPEAETES